MDIIVRRVLVVKKIMCVNLCVNLYIYKCSSYLLKKPYITKHNVVAQAFCSLHSSDHNLITNWTIGPSEWSIIRMVHHQDGPSSDVITRCDPQSQTDVTITMLDQLESRKDVTITKNPVSSAGENWVQPNTIRS